MKKRSWPGPDRNLEQNHGTEPAGGNVNMAGTSVHRGRICSGKVLFRSLHKGARWSHRASCWPANWEPNCSMGKDKCAWWSHRASLFAWLQSSTSPVCRWFNRETARHIAAHCSENWLAVCLTRCGSILLAWSSVLLFESCGCVEHANVSFEIEFIYKPIY